MPCVENGKCGEGASATGHALDQLKGVANECVKDDRILAECHLKVEKVGGKAAREKGKWRAKALAPALVKAPAPAPAPAPAALTAA